MKAIIGRNNNAKSQKAVITIGKQLKDVPKKGVPLVFKLVLALETEKEKTNVDFVSGNMYLLMSLHYFAVCRLPKKYFCPNQFCNNTLFKTRWQCLDENVITLQSCLDVKCRTAVNPSRCRKFFRTFLTKKSVLEKQDCENIVRSKRRRPHNPKNQQKISYRRKNIPKSRRTKNKQAGAWRRIMTRKKRKWKGKNRKRKS